MDAKDRAIIVSQEISTNYQRVRVGDDISGMQKMIQDAIEAAARAAYNKAIEDAAQVAGTFADELTDAGRRATGFSIQVKIEELKKA